MAVVISDQLLDRSDRLLDAEPDEHLVSLAQTGHEAAFAAIVRRYEPELLAQARRLSSDGRAEDAVQQAFLNAFAALQAGREIRHLRGWLHQILRNVVTRARVPADAPLEVELAVGDSLEETVLRRAHAHATLVELSALPERQRDALVGTAVHGLPRAHVAQAMGLSEGAVRQLVHRARRRLRQAATALLPLPLAKLCGAARSGAAAAPDAAIGATTAATGGLAIKVGTLLASGVVATGLAVTQTFPGHHDRAARRHVAHARVARHVTEAPLSGAAAVSVVSAVHRSSAPVGEGGTRGSAGRLQATRSRRGGPDRAGGQVGGRGHEAGTRGGESPAGSSGHGGEGGSSGSAPGGGGTNGDRGGSGSTSGRSGSGSSGSAGSGSSTSSGSGGDGAPSRTQGTSGHDGSGSGHDGGGSGESGASGSVSPVASSQPASSIETGDTTSDHVSGSSGGSTDSGGSGGSAGTDGSAGSGGSGGSGGSSGSQKDSGGSRDVSGSLDSSSS